MPVDRAMLDPKPQAIVFKDPRWYEASQDRQVGVIAFYYPGKEEVWDTLCGAGFLGNFYEMGDGALQLEAPCNPGHRWAFRNAEAAFQALKFWRLAEEFSGLSGKEAFSKKRSLRGREDFTYGGYGSNWKGMLAVLHAKFRKGTPWADALVKTEDSFLLEHNAISGRDKVWSDNSDGEGTNWLGFQLMLIRDELMGRSAWTSFIAGLVSLDSGEPLTRASADMLQAAVRSANRAVVEDLRKLPLCLRPGCGKTAVSGDLSGYCSRSCWQSSREAAGARPAEAAAGSLADVRRSMGLAAASSPAQDTAVDRGAASAMFGVAASTGNAGALDGAAAAAALGISRDDGRPKPTRRQSGVRLPVAAAEDPATAPDVTVAAREGHAELAAANADAGDSQALVPLAEDLIHLKIKGPGDTEVQLSVRKETNLRVLMAAACSRLGLQSAHASFWHNGKEVLPLHTAEVLGLQEGDILEAEGPLAAAAQPARRAHKGRVQLPQWCMDLEWSCPSCSAEYPASTEAMTAEPKATCMRCGWQGYPEVQERTSVKKHLTVKSRQAADDLNSERRASTVSTSGYVLEKDFEGQHVEAPLGGLLALVSQVQRERLCAGLLCYLAFCITFVVVVTLGRPLDSFFEIQQSLHQELVVNDASSLANTGPSLMDVSNWEDFWTWVDGVLVEEVFAENHSAIPTQPLASHARFTIGRYNRVLTAIRFQQVRARPTLPECPRMPDGSHPTPFEMACTTGQPFGHTESCDTPVHSHQLSRPCWGFFSAGYQDIEYPSAIQKETASISPPAQDLLCLQSCDAYHAQGARTSEQWTSFGRSDILAWVADFARLNARAEDALAACRGACDVSGSTFRTDLTDTAGYCGSRAGKPPQLLLANVSCFGDVVDLPLAPAAARELVAAMRRERWTNEGTRSLVVDINTYNPNYDVATAVRIAIQAHPGGSLSPSIEMWSCRFTLYNGGTDTLRLLLEVLFTLWIVYYILIEVSEMYLQRLTYFTEAWNYVELANLGIYTYTTISWFMYINGTYKDLEAFKDVSPSTYHDLYTIAKGFNSITLASFNLIYGFIRFTKYFRVNFQFKILWDTLARALQKVLPLLLIYGISLLGFSWSGHWLFGHRVDGFQSLVSTIMMLLLSVKEGIEYKEIHDASPAAAAIWYLAWYLCSSLIFVNLLLTVVISNFSVVKRQAEHHERVEREALDRSMKLPSLLLTWLRENSPVGLLRASQKDKVSKEMNDNIAELTESLFEVDLEALWARLLEGVTEDEVAVDAAELKFLFGGSQRKARLFINRVCNLAQLPRVEAGGRLSTLRAISELQSSAESLGAEIDGCSLDLQARYPVLEPFMQPAAAPEPIPEELPSAIAVGYQEAAAEDAAEEEVGGGGAQGASRGREGPRSLFTRGIEPPARGELRLAAAALDFRRQQHREAQQPVSSAPLAEGLTAVEPWLPHEEATQGRAAIASFVEAKALKRC